MTDTAIEEIVAAPKVKLCLTVSMDQLQQKRPIPFLDLTLMDRAIVDDPEKLDPSNLQLIPYIGLIRKSKREDAMPWDLEILTYVRSTKGNEKRLTDKLSIGFGGHIDRLPTEDETLLDLVVEEGRRELMEELGYSISRKLFSQYVQMELLVKQSLLYTTDLPVDTVHLGIPIIIQDDSTPDVFTSPDGECVEIQWMEISTIDADTSERFENWSSIIVDGLQESVANFTAQHAQQMAMANTSEPSLSELMQAINDNQAGNEAGNEQISELLLGSQDPEIVTDVAPKVEAVNTVTDAVTTASNETI